jgi:virulence-associated protein VapD
MAQTNEVEILIKSFFDNKGVTAAYSAMNKIGEFAGGAGRDMASVQFGSDMFGKLTQNATQLRQEMIQNAYLNQFGLNLKNLATNADRNTKAYRTFRDSLNSSGFEKFQANIFSSSRLMRQFGLDASQVKRQFQMEFLGVMFLGMQMQKTFQSLATSTVGSLMKMSEGFNPAAQSVNALSATWEMLKFSIGEAIGNVLTLLLPIIIPLITAFADWVQQNGTLVGSISLLGILLGGLLYLIGSLSLGITSILQVTDLLFGSAFAKKVGTATTEISAFQKVINGITRVVGIAFIIEGMTDFIEGGKNSLMSGLAEISTGLGLMAATSSNASLAKAGLILGGVGLFVKLLVDSSTDAQTSLAEDALDLFAAAYLGFKAGGPWGAFGAITVVVLFKLGAAKWLADQGDAIDKWANEVNPDLKFSYTGGNGILGSEDIARNKQKYYTGAFSSEQNISIPKTDEIQASFDVMSRSITPVNNSITQLNDTVVSLNDSMINLQPPPIFTDKKVAETMKLFQDNLNTTTTAISGTKSGKSTTGGLTNATSDMNTKFTSLQEALNIVNPLIDNLYYSLTNEASAANSAAAAHERYNRALQGATGEF